MSRADAARRADTALWSQAKTRFMKANEVLRSFWNALLYPIYEGQVSNELNFKRAANNAYDWHNNVIRLYNKLFQYYEECENVTPKDMQKYQTLILNGSDILKIFLGNYETYGSGTRILQEISDIERLFADGKAALQACMPPPIRPVRTKRQQRALDLFKLHASLNLPCVAHLRDMRRLLDA